MDGQGTKWHRNIAENFNRLGRAHERYRQTTDGRTTTYSDHELEFTFAKNDQTEVRTTWWRVFLASMNSAAQETGDTLYGDCRFQRNIVLLHLYINYLTAAKLKTLYSR